MIHPERIKILNQKKAQKNSQYVLYWMQASQRIEDNHALKYAISKGNEYKLPLLVYFGLTADFPEANSRHYQFMLEGLLEVKTALENRGVQFILHQAPPIDGLLELSRNACCVITDRGYLRLQKQWRKEAADRINCPLIQIESDVIVPVETVSTKEEYSAATIRRKIMGQVDYFLKPVKEILLEKDSLNIKVESHDISNIQKILKNMKIKTEISPAIFTGGTSKAKQQLFSFIDQFLENYSELRNIPGKNALSNMSPYLHFGQISPLFIAQKILESGKKGGQDYLEQLIVRRELAINFVHYNPFYDSFEGLPQWAQKTLILHSKDKRPYLYSIQQLENAQTHDPYWNLYQKQMVETGKMHGYMRMYWGKKILEWSENPQQAYQNALCLNNKYELDGRDPNAFAGIAWCFGKHDRPWVERKVFGNIRYMNETGLKRKGIKS